MKFAATIFLITVVCAGCTKQKVEEAPLAIKQTYTMESVTELQNSTKAQLDQWGERISASNKKMQSAENQSLARIDKTQVPAELEINVKLGKAALDELSEKRDDFQGLYNVVLQLYSVDEINFNNFKSKAEKKELAPDIIDKELRYYTTHWDGYQNDIKSWENITHDLEVSSAGNCNTLNKIAAP